MQSRKRKDGCVFQSSIVYHETLFTFTVTNFTGPNLELHLYILPVFFQLLGEIVALKRLKMEKEKEGFPITSLREINTLLKAQHPNIVTVRVIKNVP